MDNFLDKTNGPMMTFFDVVYKLVILNLLFVLFSLFGLVIFGVFPSWLTLHQLLKREFHDKEKGIKYFQEYKTYFMENFVPGNILFLVVIVVGGITVLDAIFIYDQYLTADTVTFIGIIFAIGGLLFAYVVFGMITILGTIWGYYDRFQIKSAIKFTFFTVLSSPIFTFLSMIIIGLGYLVFSILVSAAPFLAVSLPVTGIVLLYGKQYERIFLIKKEAGYGYYSFRYIHDISRFIDVINSVLPDETMYIDDTVFTSLIKKDTIDIISSVVVLDNLKQVVGFMVVSSEENEGTIECIVVKKNKQSQGIGTTLVNMLIDKKEYHTLVCRTNHSTMHKSFNNITSLRLLCKKIGFTEIEKDIFKLDL